MNFPTNDERRSEARKPLRGQARVRWHSTNKTETVNLLEVSATGLSYVGHASAASGSIGDMEFDLPAYKGAPARRLNGEVKVIGCVLSARDGGFRTGTIFVRLPSDVRSLLDKYLG